MAILNSKDEKRFLSKINRNGPTMPHMDSPCWLFVSAKDRQNYSRFKWQRKTRKAHIVSYIYHYGYIPKTYWPEHGECVCHKCDNPECVNPEHLFLDTVQGNCKDRDNKNRQAKGEKNSGAKISNVKAQMIKFDCFSDKYRDAKGLKKGTREFLAKKHGVHVATISKISSQRTWKFLPKYPIFEDE